MNTLPWCALWACCNQLRQTMRWDILMLSAEALNINEPEGGVQSSRSRHVFREYRYASTRHAVRNSSTILTLALSLCWYMDDDFKIKFCESTLPSSQTDSDSGVGEQKKAKFCGAPRLKGSETVCSRLRTFFLSEILISIAPDGGCTQRGCKRGF
jgi:hypothetical protein